MDQQLTDLMQEELDGALEETGRRRLRAAIRQDPRAGVSYEQLRSLFESLSSLSRVDPPEDLEMRVLAGIRGEVPESRAGAAVPATESWFRRLLPLAAGLALGVLLHSLLVTVTGPGHLPLSSGTLLDPGATQPLSALEPQVISSGDLEGRVRLHAGITAAALEIEVNSESSLLIDLKFDGSRVRFLGFSQTSNRLQLAESREDGIHLRVDAPVHLRLDLGREAEAEVVLRLLLYPESNPVTVTLEWPAGQEIG